MAKPRAKSLTNDQMQAIARALADPRRFAILQQIAHKNTMPCTALEEQQIISPATISHHLKELADAGLVGVQREGRCANLTLRRDIWKAYLGQLAKL
ncbi:MAG TPA: helix-turn-helix domain-containing protein [Acidobacteriaceae bacterium]|jgi:ArsR family transcriptional regulator|nr:helix-turn-helix domain-containing protein [Acidobacteriaceae bacterium]